MRGSRAVFVELFKSRTVLTLDVSKGTASAKTELGWQQGEKGQPVLDLISDATALSVDGKKLQPKAFGAVADPDRASEWRLIEEVLDRGKHEAVIEYPITRDVTFSPRGVEFGLYMSDLRPREYLERQFPTNYLHDRYPASVEVNIVGAGREHRIIANGKISGKDGRHLVEYPGYFNASSPYLHVIDPSKYTILETTMKGKAGPIPLLVYSTKAADAEEAMTTVRKTIAELEQLIGPYPHAGFIVEINRNGSSMEYSGATRCRPESLRHEIIHMWFGRSVLPASGNDGWLDEAVTTWLDKGAPTARALSTDDTYPALASFSPYRRQTTRSAYSHGVNMLAELDLILKRSNPGGLKYVLREFFTTYKNQTVTTKMWEKFVQERCPEPLEDFFKKRLYSPPTAAELRP